MRIKVIKRYKDKVTKITHEIGEVLEVTKARGAVIIKAGYAIETTESVTIPAATESVTIPSIDSLKFR